MKKTLYLINAMLSAVIIGIVFVILDEQQHSVLIEFSLICLACAAITVASITVSKI